ncbi:MAG: hypothetical protein R2854_19540 [Caldilineaceae bacterium]
MRPLARTGHRAQALRQYGAQCSCWTKSSRPTGAHYHGRADAIRQGLLQSAEAATAATLESAPSAAVCTTKSTGKVQPRRSDAAATGATVFDNAAATDGALVHTVGDLVSPPAHVVHIMTTAHSSISACPIPSRTIPNMPCSWPLPSVAACFTDAALHQDRPRLWGVARLSPAR